MKKKNKNKNWIYPIFLIGTLLMLINSCSKNDKDDHESPASPANPTNGKTTALFNSNLTYGTMSDQDGNTYKTIQIGSQIWMAENLRTTKFRNGEAIPEVTEKSLWAILSTSAYCNYKNTSNIDTIATFGRLYNWYTISDSRNIAPKGWHIPTNEDWEMLITYIGGVDSGGKLKEIGLGHWLAPNTDASNTSGFTALPGGICNGAGSFLFIGNSGIWWSSTKKNLDEVWAWYMYNNYNVITSYENPMNEGFSIRCIRD